MMLHNFVPAQDVPQKADLVLSKGSRGQGFRFLLGFNLLGFSLVGFRTLGPVCLGPLLTPGPVRLRGRAYLWLCHPVNGLV